MPRYIVEIEKVTVKECVVTADNIDEAHDKFNKSDYEIISEKDYYDYSWGDDLDG